MWSTLQPVEEGTFRRCWFVAQQHDRNVPLEQFGSRTSSIHDCNIEYHKIAIKILLVFGGIPMIKSTMTVTLQTIANMFES